MIKIDRHEEEIINKIRHMKKGVCPNIIITGKSISALERLGRKVTACLEKQQIFDFTGLYKHFSVRMPYFDLSTGSEKFMNHLLSSISIARDCYDKYRGIILIEVASEWSKEGANDALNTFWDFLRKQEDICFIILLLEINEHAEINGFFTEFFRCGKCIKAECEVASADESVAYFESAASSKGYSVSVDASQYLYKRMEERDQVSIDNTEILVKLLDQILFDKEMETSKQKEIGVADICCYLPENPVINKHKIGFIK